MGMIILNGIAYTSTDGARDFPPLVYSTEEQEIGVWIDGKPLYEKSVSFGAIAANTIDYQLDCSILTVDNLIDMNCIVYSGNSFIKLPLALFQPGSTYSDYGINLQGFNKTTGKVRIDTGADRSISSGYITIQYTKTTDTPGSGKWSAFGGGSNVIHEEYFEWKRGTSTTTAESMRYTAPCDGWVTVLQYMDKNNDVYCCVEAAIYNPNTNVTKQVDIDDGRQRYHTWHLGFPAKRGDVIIIKTRLDSGTLPTSATFRFMG